MWSKIVLVGRIIAVAWALWVGIMEVLTYYQIVTVQLNFQPIVWLVSLVVMGIGSLGGIIGDHLAESKTKKGRKYEAALMGLLINLSGASDIRFQHLGGSVYTQAPRWQQFLHRRSHPDTTLLHRIHRFRPADYPPPSAIRWTSRTGAVGECWTAHRTIHKSLYEVAEQSQGGLTPKQFDVLESGSQGGFTVGEFNIIAPKYSEVLATPLLDKQDRQIGVLSIDRSYVRVNQFESRLDDPGIQPNISATAAIISNIME